MKPLIIYAQDPTNYTAKAFAEYLVTQNNRPVLLLLFADLPPNPTAAKL